MDLFLTHLGALVREKKKKGYVEQVAGKFCGTGVGKSTGDGIVRHQLPGQILRHWHGEIYRRGHCEAQVVGGSCAALVWGNSPAKALLVGACGTSYGPLFDSPWGSS